jgi:Flp pilus assembly protein TadD
MNTLDIAQNQSGALQALAALRTGFDLNIAQLRAMAHVAHLKMTSADFAGALRIYSVLALMAPEETGFQVGLADAAIAERNFELAMAAASLIISLDPSDPRGYYLSGRASLGLGEHQAARDDLQTAIKVATAKGDARTRDLADRLMTGLRTV